MCVCVCVCVCVYIINKYTVCMCVRERERMLLYMVPSTIISEKAIFDFCQFGGFRPTTQNSIFRLGKVLSSSSSLVLSCALSALIFLRRLR